MDILLLDRLVPEALAWLEERHRVVSRLDIAKDPSEVRKAIYKAAAVVLPRRIAITREWLDFAPLLKVVARMQAGNDNTDLEACRAHKIRVIQASTANVRANAEYLLAALLTLYRRGMVEAIRGGPPEAKFGRELHGSVVGMFGLAPTAHMLAVILNSLGAKMVGYDPAVHSTAPIWEKLQIQPVSLPEMLAQSDAISVQVMFASRYLAFINDKMLAHCKPGQIWVGVSRSQLFDPLALARALSDGRIEAAMLDGASSGFAAKDTPLHELPNLYLTPRLGSHTLETRSRASWFVVRRIHEALANPSAHGLETPSIPHLDPDDPVSGLGPVSALGPFSGPGSLY